jgi:hypothetical protein
VASWPELRPGEPVGQPHATVDEDRQGNSLSNPTMTTLLALPLGPGAPRAGNDRDGRGLPHRRWREAQLRTLVDDAGLNAARSASSRRAAWGSAYQLHAARVSRPLLDTLFRGAPML